MINSAPNITIQIVPSAPPTILWLGSFKSSNFIMSHCNIFYIISKRLLGQRKRRALTSNFIIDIRDAHYSRTKVSASKSTYHLFGTDDFSLGYSNNVINSILVSFLESSFNFLLNPLLENNRYFFIGKFNSI